MAKKKTTKAKKAAVVKNFVVLDEYFNSCCGQAFATKEDAIKEAKSHIGTYNDKYFIAQLLTKLETPETVEPVITEL